MEWECCTQVLAHLLPNLPSPYQLFLFFFNDTATTEIYTLSLHDALPICRHARSRHGQAFAAGVSGCARQAALEARRSEEHTSELQSRRDLVCRLLLEKKKKHTQRQKISTVPNRKGRIPRHFKHLSCRNIL